jgi:hypothetical protein
MMGRELKQFLERAFEQVYGTAGVAQPRQPEAMPGRDES